MQRAPVISHFRLASLGLLTEIFLDDWIRTPSIGLKLVKIIIVCQQLSRRYETSCVIRERTVLPAVFPDVGSTEYCLIEIQNKDAMHDHNQFA